MAQADQLLGMYLHLARASKVRRQPMVRTRLLLMAAVQAEEMGLEEISALCRHKILSQNPRHLVRRWPTIGEALGHDAFQTHLKQLRRRYSREKIEHMMHSLGIEMGRERAAYFTDQEYAAALLDTKVEAIAAVLAEDPLPRRKRHEPQRTATEPLAVAAAKASTAPKMRNLMIVWAPFIVGLVALAALALAVRR